MKKILIIVVAVLIVAGVGLYLFVFSEAGEKPEVRVEYSPGEFFTTNVRVSSGTPRLLKAAVILVVNETGLEETLANENARIRDTIIFILRDLTVEEIMAEGEQEELRERIINALNERLVIDNFVEVLFNDFVMA